MIRYVLDPRIRAPENGLELGRGEGVDGGVLGDGIMGSGGFCQLAFFHMRHILVMIEQGFSGFEAKH